MELNKFWQLQKAANLSNAQAAKWLDVKVRQISRWRNEYEAPRAVILALKYRIKYGAIDEVMQGNNPK